MSCSPNDKYDLLPNNAYAAKDQSFAETEVGDVLQPDFHPQVKIKRWDNEVNFSVRLVHEEAAAQVKAEDGKIKWVGEKQEAHFYEIGSLAAGGGFEFEVICHEKPKDGKVQMTIQTKGLEFFYQPELTPEEVVKGCIRPENVVGSYAVYHQTMSGDYSRMGGKNYQTGKAFHIYRPRIEDAAGNWIWGELKIDAAAGLLTVTIPQDFLDKAVYPVHHAAGLEFGYHAVGASEDSYGGQYNGLMLAYGGGGNPATPDFDGTLTSISLYAKLDSGSPSFCPSLYANSGGVPNARLAYLDTGGTPISSSSYGWVVTNLSNSIVSNTQYRLGEASPDGGNFRIRYDDCANSETYYATRSTWPATASDWSSIPRRYSIFATYTASGGAINLYPVAIPGAEAVGVPLITRGAVAFCPQGIPSGETVGVPNLARGPVALYPQGLPTGGAFGLPAFTPGPVSITGAGNIPGAAAFGLPAIAIGPISITVAGNISSQETFGPLTLTTGPVAINRAGNILSGEALGLPMVGDMQFVDLPEKLALALDSRRLWAVPTMRRLAADPQITRLQVTPDA